MFFLNVAVKRCTYPLQLIVICFCLGFFPPTLWAKSSLSQINLLPSISDFDNPQHKEKIQDWLNFIKNGQNLTLNEKLTRTNQYFNDKIVFTSDLEHYGQDDYWATPSETLISGVGDCEDFSIAKYITLIAIGIPESQLRMMYVKALTLNQAHMVVIFNHSDKSEPLVLDNLNSEILPASQRTDLKPVYSFNSQGLWLTKQQGVGKQVNQRKGHTPWVNLLKRINMGQ